MASRALRLAAAALPMRNRSIGFELLMVRRNPELSFGGMWTFPGGSLDLSDGPFPVEVNETVQNWTDLDLLATAEAAAAREVAEETALLCSIEDMVWFSHWIPPDEHGPPKRFATWFFLAPNCSGDVIVDLSENSEARWITPGNALAQNAAGQFPVAVPTWVTLDDLQPYESVAAAKVSARANGPRIHHTRAVRDGNTSTLMWEGDSAYEQPSSTTDGRKNRVVMNRSGEVVSRSVD